MSSMNFSKPAAKLINLCLIACICLAFHSRALPQRQETQPASYQAELLVSEGGKKIKAEQVTLWLEDDELRIRGLKNARIDRSIPFSAIESADYTYSDRPRYTAGTLAVLAFGVGGLAIFFTKTKKNWLTVNAGKDSAILQLRAGNYRMLLLQMRKKGIKISDSGDRDEKADAEKTKSN